MSTRSPAPLSVAPAAPAAPASDPALVLSWLDKALLQYVGPGARAAMRAIVLALVCPVPSNVLMVGPPGVAKTSMIGAIARALACRFFDVTLSPWTQDADLLGAVDVNELTKHGRVVRALHPSTPTLLDADLVHLDELPRATAGIRALAMSALADRRSPGGALVPAHVIVASANTRLTSEDDAAVVDRFALRVEVPRLLDLNDLMRVITRRVPVDGVAPTAAPLPTLDPSLLSTLRARADVVDMPRDVAVALTTFALVLRGAAPGKASAAPEGAAFPDVSERRWEITAKLLQASACLNGRDRIDWSDLADVLPLVTDNGPESRAAIANALKSSIPSWVAQLADLDEAIRRAIARARRVGGVVDMLPDDAADHARRAETFDAALGALAPFGADVVRRAQQRIDDAEGAIDDAYAEAAEAYQARRKRK